MKLITARNLVKIYDENGSETHALRGIDISINDGEFVAIMGPSGSGKSTLAQILGCLDRPTSGEYFLEGKEVSKYADTELAFVRNRKFGFVFQMFNLLPRLSVLENVELPLLYARVPAGKRENMAREMISLVGLSEREKYKTAKLSGGEKQRAAIARALVTNPRVIFADEPTGSLDSKSGETILRTLEKLNNDGRTIILITHESYVTEFAGRIIHIKDGKIESDETRVARKSVARDGFAK